MADITELEELKRQLQEAQMLFIDHLMRSRSQAQSISVYSQTKIHLVT